MNSATWKMAAVVDSFQYKRLVLKAVPRVGDVQESKEKSFWKKFKVCNIAFATLLPSRVSLLYVYP